MALSKSRFLILGMAFVLAGCSFASEALFPSLGGEGSTSYYDGAPPSLGSTDFEPPRITPGQPTGTFVGQKVLGFRSELQQLRDSISQRNQQLQQIRAETVAHSQAYHESVANINARLQVGTTPGNPELQGRWNQAQQRLDLIGTDVARMNQLATQVASDSAMAVYLLDSVRAAFSLSGAVDEDHRQLRILEDETNQTTVLIERLLTELSQDISRQQSYVANERGNLGTLSLGITSGQLYGASLGNQSAIRSAGFTPTADRRPLVVIRFDRQNVAYQQALYQAVSRAIERRPDAAFDLVAVSPALGSAGDQASSAATARRNAEQVLRSLSEMGLPANRVRMSATSSPTASSNEVHLYVR